MQNDIYFHRRNLPHIYIANATYFITFRLAGSIPDNKLKVLHTWKNNIKFSGDKNRKMIHEAMFFDEYDKLIHSTRGNELVCYSIMPNHVHMVFSLLNESIRVDKIMQNIKRISAFRANKIINKSGTFWQAESYDHVVRNEEELEKIVNYVLFNPVKAKLVEDWKEWEFSYFKYL